MFSTRKRNLIQSYDGFQDDFMFMTGAICCNYDWLRALTNNDVLKHSSSLTLYMLALSAESIPLQTV